MSRTGDATRRAARSRTSTRSRSARSAMKRRASLSCAAPAALAERRRIADAIAADLVKIGITVDVRTEAAATLGARSRSGEVPLWLGDRIAERADADEFLSAVSSNAVVQELVRRARAEN